MIVHFELLASLGDQPERRSMNFLMGGNSKVSARFGFIGNLGAMK